MTDERPKAEDPPVRIRKAPETDDRDDWLGIVPKGNAESPMEHVASVSDTFEQLNRLLWELAKSFLLIAVIFTSIVLMYIAYNAAEFMVVGL